MKLYEIDNAIGAFQPEIDEETGELLNADALDALQMERDKKIESTCLLYKNLDADVAALDAEIKELTKRRDAKKNRRDGVKKYIEYALKGETFETARCKVGYRKSQSCNVADDSVFWSWAVDHTEYVRRKDPEPNREEIKKALLAGKEIPGAALVEKVSMNIK